MPGTPEPATSTAADFDFVLPPQLIAQHPAVPRDRARLLHVEGPRLRDLEVAALPSLLRPGDVLVANDTAVIPAQLSATRGGARIGVTLDRPLPDGTWHVLLRNARRVRPGDMLAFERSDERAKVVTRDEDGGGSLRFRSQGAAFERFLRQAGRLALPPYIERPDGPTEADGRDYQTIFAAREGAVAAPTAGLHFTPALLAALQARGVGRETLTLHVGAGTFLPVRVEAIERHRMHAERGIIEPATAERLNRARDAGGRLVAVGTTSLRLLESAVSATGRIVPFDGETSLFIRPGHRFRTADLLLTNFHLPRSTLFMLVCAFGGSRPLRAAYAHAVASGYRFFSYGDACLLERGPS